MRPGSIAACFIVLLGVRPARGDETRHQFGLQLGGSNLIQYIYRIRAFGPLAFEVGGFAAPYSPVMGSVGIFVQKRLGNRWSVYTSGGVGGLISGSEYECNLATQPNCSDRTDWGYFYGRLGITLHVLDGSHGERHFVAADVGIWRGTISDYAAGTMRDERGFTTLMPGLAWFLSF